MQVAVGTLGFYLADHFMKEVSVESPQFLLYTGLTLGTINFFIRPLLRLVTFPLRLLTLGLFTFLINIAIIWFVQAMFVEVVIDGPAALLYTTLIVWILEFITHSFSK